MLSNAKFFPVNDPIYNMQYTIPLPKNFRTLPPDGAYGDEYGGETETNTPKQIPQGVESMGGGCCGR
jgi:hypothetical protein